MANDSRFKDIVAALGWVVAVLALLINYLTYREKKIEKIRAAQQEPTFSYDVLTYSSKSLPSELLKLKQPIRHEFVIRHESGGPVLDLFAEFSSQEANIIGLEVVAGRQGVLTEVDGGKREASLRKAEVLSSQTIKGYLLTEGVSEVRMNAGARSGKPLIELAVATPEPEPVNWFLWAYILALSIAVLASIVLLLRSYRHLVGLGLLGKDGQVQGKSFSLLSALLGLALLMDLLAEVSFSSLFYE